MGRWNMILLIVVLAVSASCTRQIEITPMPTSTSIPMPTATLSREEAARYLTQRVTDNLHRLSQLNALCDNVLNGGINAYHEAMRDTFAELLSQPESRRFGLDTLQTIFTQGIKQAYEFFPPTAQTSSTIAPQLMGQTVEGREVILATWGTAPCHPSGHVHYGTALYVFDTTGQVLLEGGAEKVSAHPAMNGWLVTGGDIFGSYKLWHIHPANNHWEQEILFQGSKIVGLSINDRAIQVDYEGPSFKPPCRFRPEIAATFDHALLSGGQQDWVWHDGHYNLTKDHFQKATVYVGLAGGTLLEDWQKYCDE